MIDELLPFVLKAILRCCSEVPGPDVEVNFYIARRRLLRFKLAQLEHVGQCPMSDTAASPPVTRWARRGPVGLCWKQGEDVCIDVQAVFASYEPINHYTWKSLPRAITGVFGWDDYVRSQAHAVVLALPVRNASGATMAVLSVEGP